MKNKNTAQFEKTVFQTIQNHGLFDHCTGIVAAVSGGPDSMALLHFLIKNLPQYPIVVAHVHHGLRQQADAEQQMVQEYCQINRVPFYAHQANIRQTKSPGTSIEQYARTVRYTFFEQIRTQHQFSHIATAHNADDSTETFFLDLLRGCGTARTIQPKRLTPNGAVLIRPFIQIPKSATETYCNQNQVPFALDQTNFENCCTRNKLRNDILPQLRQINPNLNQTIDRFSQIAQTDDYFLNEQAAKLFKQASENGQLHIKKLRKAHDAVLSRVVRDYTAQRGVQISYPITRQIIQIIRGKSSCAETDIGQNLKVQRCYDMLRIRSDNDPPLSPIACRKLFAGPNILDDNRILLLDYTPTKADIPKEYITDLYVRSPKQADTIKLRRRGTKTLKKLFIDSKVPRELRSQIPVIEYQGKVIYVFGFGSDECCSADSEGYKVSVFSRKTK